MIIKVEDMMKKLVLSVIILCGFTMSLLAQGIQFREGNWKEILEIAKKENKLVFVDNYTSWCGPCKKMVSEIFPLKEVGDFYNANFICYKLDCEKGDGVEVAKTYQIMSFPTYLYVDGNGKLFYRSGSYMPAEKFIAEGKIALAEFSDKRTIEEWEALYSRKKNNASFVKGYIAKRNRAKLDNADILDQYVSIEKEKNLMDTTFLKELLAYDNKLNAGGACADFIMRNWERIREMTGMKAERMAEFLSYSMGRYSYSRAVKEKNEERFDSYLKVMAFLNEKLGADVANEEVKSRSRFYAAVEDKLRFEKLAEKHADILFEEEKDCLERDHEKYMQFLQNLIKDPSGIASQTPEHLAFTIQFAGINESSSLAFSFRDLAANVARLSDNRELLNKAITWALEAITLFGNFTCYETLAEVLYKMGYQKEALWQMEKALDKMPAGNDAIAARIHGKLDKIKNNK